MFGIDRLKRFLETSYALGANEFAGALVDELSRWSEYSRGQGQEDDITILAIRFQADKGL